MIATGNMAYLELLQRSSVIGNLERAVELIEEVLDRRRPPGSSRLGPSPPRGELTELRNELVESLALEQRTPDDDLVYLPRDPLISAFQSGVEQHASGIERPGARTAVRASQVEADLSPGLAREPLPPITDRRLPLPDAPGQALSFQPGSFRPWPTDFLWGGIIAAAAARRLVKGNVGFNPNPARCTLATDAKIYLLSDWASGIPRAVMLASRITQRLKAERHPDVHVVHLGDTYYAGWPWEAQDRALAPWPVPLSDPDLASSWALNGNHDMYSGGKGYFETILNDRRFAQQHDRTGHATSVFELSNDDWLVLGLDTAWTNDRFHLGTSGGMTSDQVDWIEQSIRDASGRKVMLLSHHQLFSAYQTPTMLESKLGAFLREHRVHSWFWGHEHCCTLYRPAAEVEYPRTIGNGGVPTSAAPQPVITPNIVELDFDEPYPVLSDGQEVLQFGFVVLEFHGSSVKVTYVNENDKAWHAETL